MTREREKAVSSNLLAKFDDDWSGLSSRVERRKIQNRLLQRARSECLDKHHNLKMRHHSHKIIGRRQKATHFTQRDTECDRLAQGCNICPNTHNPAPLQQRHTGWSLPWPLSLSPGHDSPTNSDLPLVTTPSIQIQQTRNHPIQPNFSFPLTPDHLIVLIHYNVYRACISNTLLLNLGDLSNETCKILTSPPPPNPIPVSLHPTHLQQSIPHPCWIDILPDHKLRDNLILAQGFYDERSLFNDLVGEVCNGLGTCSTSNSPNTSGVEFGDTEEERRGLIVWSDPWDVAGWEVTPGFLRKWGWMLRGCDELIAGSNRWRAQRDEEPLLLTCADVFPR